MGDVATGANPNLHTLQTTWKLNIHCSGGQIMWPCGLNSGSDFLIQGTKMQRATDMGCCKHIGKKEFGEIETHTPEDYS